MSNQIAQVEIKFPVENLLVNGDQVWPYLRIRYFFRLRQSHYPKRDGTFFWYLQKTWVTFFFIVFSLPNFFRSARYLCFSTNQELRDVGNLRLNKLFFQLFDVLGNENFLRFDQTPISPTRDDFYDLQGKVVATRFFEALSYIISFFVRPKFEGPFQILDEVSKELKVGLNFKRAIKVMVAARIIAKVLLKFKSPNLIFISYYYSIFHMALIAEAKALKIPTIEFQHGVINDKHPAYNRNNPGLSTQFYPDWLLTYGNNVKERLGETAFIDPKRIVTMGHPLISFYESSELQKTLTRINSPFIGICLVTLQEINEIAVLNMISEFADSNPNYEILLLPRNSKRFQLPVKLKRNQIKVVHGSFYELISQATVHITASSTTALEAPAFGIPNVLLDYDGMATKYYGPELGLLKHTFFARSAEEIKDGIEKLARLTQEEIKHIHNVVLVTNAKENLKLFLEREHYI